jgi:hypothetical protein
MQTSKAWARFSGIIMIEETIFFDIDFDDGIGTSSASRIRVLEVDRKIVPTTSRLATITGRVTKDHMALMTWTTMTATRVKPDKEELE